MYGEIKPIQSPQDAIDRLQYIKRLIQNQLFDKIEVNPTLCDISAIQMWIDPSFNANKWENQHKPKDEDK